jgi:DNA-binding protein H-NS
MLDVSYDNLSLAELQQIQADVAKAIASYHACQKAEAKAKINAIAIEYGFSNAAELVQAQPRKSRAKPVPHFRNPNNHKQVCGNAGRKPQWFMELLQSGYTKEDLLISNQTG